MRLFLRRKVFSMCKILIRAQQKIARPHVFKKRFFFNVWAGIAKNFLINRYILSSRLNGSCCNFLEGDLSKLLQDVWLPFVIRCDVCMMMVRPPISKWLSAITWMPVLRGDRLNVVAQSDVPLPSDSRIYLAIHCGCKCARNSWNPRNFSPITFRTYQSCISGVTFKFECFL